MHSAWLCKGWAAYASPGTGQEHLEAAARVQHSSSVSLIADSSNKRSGQACSVGRTSASGSSARLLLRLNTSGIQARSSSLYTDVPDSSTRKPSTCTWALSGLPGDTMRSGERVSPCSPPQVHGSAPSPPASMQLVSMACRALSAQTCAHVHPAGGGPLLQPTWAACVTGRLQNALTDNEKAQISSVLQASIVALAAPLRFFVTEMPQ